MAMPRRRSSRLRQSPSAQTPKKAPPINQLAPVTEGEEDVDATASNKPNSVPSPSVARTPTTSTPLKPSAEEMHPDMRHSAIKKLAAEQRFGFTGKSAVTTLDQTPVKQTSENLPPAPKSAPAKKSSTDDAAASSSFAFTFRHPSAELSNEAQKIMESVRGEAERIRTQLAVQRDEHMEEDGSADLLSGGRRIAMPKGKLGRFSDVHMEQFKKMDSIANHPSAFRKDPNRATKIPEAASNKALKRTNSKAELDKEDGTPKNLKRTNSKTGLTLTPQSAKSSIKVVGSETPTQGPAKRRKTEFENKEAAMSAAVAASASTDSPLKASSLSHGTAAESQSPVSTPSKIPSLTRNTSTRSLNSPSTPVQRTSNVITPAPQTAPPARQSRNNLVSKLSTMKSILRKPQLKFSNDPIKQAAGTHVSPPKSSNSVTTSRVGTSTPANRTEKHVNFTPEPARVIPRSPDASVNDTQDAPSEHSSPSPVKSATSSKAAMEERTAAETPTRPVSYPSLLPPPASAPPKSTGTGLRDFTFRSTPSSKISFAPSPPKEEPSIVAMAPSPPKNEPARALMTIGGFHKPRTIRKVRPSSNSGQLRIKAVDGIHETEGHQSGKIERLPGVPHGLSNKKRKRDSLDVGLKDTEQDEDKENSPSPSKTTEKMNTETPSQKRIKLTSPVMKTPQSSLKTPYKLRTPSRLGTPSQSGTPSRFLTPSARFKSPTPVGSASTKKVKSISWSRLNALAQPKKRN